MAGVLLGEIVFLGIETVASSIVGKLTDVIDKKYDGAFNEEVVRQTVHCVLSQVKGDTTVLRHAHFHAAIDGLRDWSSAEDKTSPANIRRLDDVISNANLAIHSVVDVVDKIIALHALIMSTYFRFGFTSTAPNPLDRWREAKREAQKLLGEFSFFHQCTVANGRMFPKRLLVTPPKKRRSECQPALLPPPPPLLLLLYLLLLLLLLRRISRIFDAPTKECHTERHKKKNLEQTSTRKGDRFFCEPKSRGLHALSSRRK